MKIQKLKIRRKRNLILDMTPLIDVVFLLLIFFMVATTFQDMNSSINIDLPKSSSKHQIKIKSLEIKIDKNLGIYLVTNNLNSTQKIKKVSKLELKQKLIENFQKMSKKNVIISADKSVSYQSLMEVLDIAKGAGASSLDLNTKNLQ